MKIGLYQLNSLLANAGTFPPSKGVLPVLAAFSSYNLDVRKMARQSLWDIQKKIINDLESPEDDQKYLDTLRESALFSAHIYNEIESNKRVTENDVVFFFNILIGTGIKGSFYAWRIWQDRFITRPYLKSQVAFFSDEMNLAFVDQYLGASLSKRREHARFFKRILKKIKSRSAILGYYAGLFKQNRHPDPFLCNLDQAALNSGSIVNTELMSPDPDVRKSALLSLAMFDPLLDQAFLRHILENDPDSEVRIAALNIIENAIPDTYSDLTQIILRILYEKPANESMAAFKALVPSLRFPPHQLMESVKVNRPDQINAILEEIASFSRITFLFSQDLSQNPSWYMTSGIHLFKAMVKGLIQRQPHALLELLNEAGEKIGRAHV